MRCFRPTTLTRIFSRKCISTRKCGNPSAPLFSTTPLGKLELLPSEALVDTLVDSYTEQTMEVNGVDMQASVILFTNFSLLWRPSTWAEVTPDALVIFEYLRDRPDFILFGSGSQTHELQPDVKAYLKRLNIGYDIMSSANASQTFLILNAEGRNVAAAILPSAATSANSDATFRQHT